MNSFRKTTESVQKDDKEGTRLTQVLALLSIVFPFALGALSMYFVEEVRYRDRGCWCSGGRGVGIGRRGGCRSIRLRVGRRHREKPSGPGLQRHAQRYSRWPAV